MKVFAGVPVPGVLLALSLGVVLAACQMRGEAALPVARSAAPAGPETEGRLLAQIRTEIGQAPCTLNAQCRTLPVGAKACGGPASWEAWSTVQTDGARLQALAAELEQAQRRRIEQSGQQSNCQFIADPGAVCVAQRCVLASRRNAS
jgi:hypothetical protein